MMAWAVPRWTLAALALVLHWVATPALCQPAQADADAALASLRAVYRGGAITEEVRLTHTPADGPARRSAVVLALSAGGGGALGLELGPLRVRAGGGRLVAWRADQPGRVYAAATDDPLTLDALTALLPPMPLPQLAAAFSRDAGLPEPIGQLRGVRWSLVPQHAQAPADAPAVLLGVGAGGSIRLYQDPASGRVTRFTVELDAGGRIDAEVRPADGPGTLLDPIQVEGKRLVPTLADLAAGDSRTPGDGPLLDQLVRAADGRLTTLRGVAPEADRLLLLVLDAREQADRDTWLAALAQADANEPARASGATLVVLAIGDDRLPRLIERVTRPRRAREDVVRGVSAQRVPPWLRERELSRGCVLLIDAASWRVRWRAPLPTRAPPAFEPGLDAGPVGPWLEAMAPASRAEAITMAITHAAAHAGGDRPPPT